jgi:hypothetical protein
MGEPLNYGLELPQRCHSLLTQLSRAAQKVHGDGSRKLGPLTSTFLLAMSMPIVIIPIERLHYVGLANDKKVNRALGKAVSQVLGDGPIEQAPFFRRGDWRYVRYWAKDDLTDVLSRIKGGGLPDRVAGDLRSDEAVSNSANLRSCDWASFIRNGLAHGGVFYLDEYGSSARANSAPVKRYAFFSKREPKEVPEGVAKIPWAGDERPDLNFLSIGEGDYRDFLRRWVSWLTTSGTAKKLERILDVAA